MRAIAALSGLAGRERFPGRRLKLENIHDEYKEYLGGGLNAVSKCIKNTINHGVRWTVSLRN